MVTQTQFPQSTPFIEAAFGDNEEKKKEAGSCLLTSVEWREQAAYQNHLPTGTVLFYSLMDKFDTAFCQYLAGAVDTLAVVIDQIKMFNTLSDHHVDQYFLTKETLSTFFKEALEWIQKFELNALLPRYEYAIQQLQPHLNMFQTAVERWNELNYEFDMTYSEDFSETSYVEDSSETY